MINERIMIEEKTKDYNEAWIETYFWQESEELYPGQKRPVIVICGTCQISGGSPSAGKNSSSSQREQR